MSIHDRILTWNNLQWQGYSGLGIFLLFKRCTKDNVHLFLHYPFTRALWDGVMEYFIFAPLCHCQSFICSLHYLFKSHKRYKFVPLYLILSIWHNQKALVFKHKGLVVSEDAIKAITSFNELGPPMKSNRYKVFKLRDIW